MFVGIALATWNASDVSLSVAGTGKVQNLVGPAGSYLADALYQSVGWGAWSVLVLTGFLALRLAGRSVGGWGTLVLGAVGLLMACGILQLLVASAGRPFPPGGLAGLLLVEAMEPRVGAVGSGLALATGLLVSLTLIFGINWQPMAARAVDGVQVGAPAAVRAVRNAGVGAARASIRASGWGLRALIARLRRDPSDDEEIDEEDEDDEGSAVLSRPLPIEVQPVPRAEPARAQPQHGAAPIPPADAGRVVPREAAGIPQAERAPPVIRRPEALPEPPSVWSARAAPPPLHPEEEDPATLVAGRTLVEVEWTQPSAVNPARIAPVPLAAPTPQPPVSAAILHNQGAVFPGVTPPNHVSAALRSTPASMSDPQGPAAHRLDATTGRTSPEGAHDEDDALDEEEDAPHEVSVGPPPPVARAIIPPREGPREPLAAAAPRTRRIGNASDAAVVPGNLRSGGVNDDGRAVRALHSPFLLPPLSLLDEHPAIVNNADEGALLEHARRLTNKLLDFGMEGHVTAIRPGPVITLFEYEPAPGVKISRIASLSDDLAMALKALSVRIVAPIPGRGVVGIEIPNERRQTVWARDVFASSEFREGHNTLPVVLGKDTEGRPYVGDLARMPHLLIGGTTGSGKSVGVNSMLVSMLFQKTPEELRMILVDPKMLEFELYQDIPHLLHPVVTEAKLASAVLKWACVEMDERYRLLARWQTRNIEGYNQKVDKESLDWTPEKARRYAPKDWPEGDLLPQPKKLPYIVIVIDELADLMMVAAKDVEESIVRLAQKARACGIHLIVATQRPSVDVITGLIKANMPSRIAYQVRSKTDGRTILDQNGAETLLGKGDLLYLPPGSSGLHRIHGPFLSDDEVRRVAEFLKEQGAPEYALKISVDDAGDGDDDLSAEMDENYDRAVDFALEKGRISTSMIQRLLKIGYNRAARIMEIMEREGVVGPADGAKPREVLVQR